MVLFKKLLNLKKLKQKCALDKVFIGEILYHHNIALSDFMNVNDEIEEYGRSKEFDIGKVFQILAATMALGLCIFLVIAATDYFNPNSQIPLLANLKEFLNTYWMIIVGFVLLISLWEYIYPLYSKVLKYVKPIIDATSLMFGLWIVSVFLKGLIVFLDQNSQVAIFLNFPHNFFFQQFVVLYLLFTFVGYSKLFLKK